MHFALNRQRLLAYPFAHARLFVHGSYVMPWSHVKQNNFGLRRRPTERILLQRVETCLKIFQKLFQKLIAAHETPTFMAHSMSLK